MSIYTFDPTALRVKKSRAARFLQKRRLFIAKASFILVGLSGLGLVSSGNRSGYLLLSFALSAGMILIWNRWDLRDLEAHLTPTLAASGKLEQILAPNVAADFVWPASPTRLWQCLGRNWQVLFFAVRFGLDPQYLQSLAVSDQAAAEPIVEQAIQLSLDLGLKSVTGGALVTALILNTPRAESYLAELGLEKDDIVSGLRWLARIERIIARASRKSYFGGIARDWTAGYTPLLSQIAQDISAEVHAGNAYHGETNIRAGLIDTMIATLAQPTRSSVALVGETGVGKTLTVYSLTERLLKGETPSLRYHKVFMLNAATLVAQARGPGEMEQLLLQILNEAARARNVILFLDEAQLFFSAGVGAVDVSKLLLPVLQSNSVRVIMAMTPADWQKLAAQNSALAALTNFQAISEPAPEETTHILQDQVLLIENRLIESGNKIRVTYQAIAEAYKLSERYIQDLAYPGKAIRLLENSINQAEERLVTARSVQLSIETTLGVKVTQAAVDEGQKLLNLEAELHKRMINQTRAVKVVSDALRRSRAGVSNQNRPIGTFLFLGPTGVGKTELSKSLADVYFSGREHMVRVDMTEYSQGADVERLLDAGANRASTLLSQIRQQPFSVVLFDEIEKAHPDVLNLFLQLIDEGRLTDNSGRVASFKDSIIISTSNAGADQIRTQIEGGRNLEDFEAEFVNNLIASQQFRPEFLNRFDEIVLFRPLTPPELKQVVRLLISEVNITLEAKKIRVELADAAADWLVKTGYDPRLGARPMRRMVQRSVENIVAKRLLGGEVSPGTTITLDLPDLESAVKSS